MYQHSFSQERLQYMKLLNPADLGFEDTTTVDEAISELYC